MNETTAKRTIGGWGNERGKEGVENNGSVWLHFDDSTVEAISSHSALRNHQPYLLMYQRTDLRGSNGSIGAGGSLGVNFGLE